jgi:lycopene cyclase domain-containing protein
MKYTYLLLNFFTILVPFFRSFEPKLHFYKKWKFYFPALVIAAIFFLVWDYFKTKHGIWSFKEDYILGLKLGGLPLEEYLFFITVPYACTFIYETVSHFISKQLFPSWTRVVMYGLSAVAFLSSFFVYEQAYTFSVLYIWGLTFPIVLNQFSAQAFDKFLLTFLISIVPMFVVNGVLTGLPVVIYNNMENSGIRIGTIPVEDFLYNAILLAMNIGLYEWFKLKYKKD